MKIAIIGRGRVGSALAPVMTRAGHEVVFGVRDVGDPKHADSVVPVLATSAAVAASEIVVAAIMLDGVDRLLADAGNMAGKILIDCINPYDFAGGLKRLIAAGTSTASIIQARTDAIVVKTLNQVGSPVMTDPLAYDVRPLQFVAADDDGAKAVVLKLLDDMGYDARDAGGLDTAADLEAMARIWIAQAFVHGMNPDTSWAFLARRL